MPLPPPPPHFLIGIENKKLTVKIIMMLFSLCPYCCNGCLLETLFKHRTFSQLLTNFHISMKQLRCKLWWNSPTNRVYWDEKNVLWPLHALIQGGGEEWYPHHWLFRSHWLHACTGNFLPLTPDLTPSPPTILQRLLVWIIWIHPSNGTKFKSLDFSVHQDQQENITSFTSLFSFSVWESIFHPVSLGIVIECLKTKKAYIQTQTVRQWLYCVVFPFEKLPGS